MQLVKNLNQGRRFYLQALGLMIPMFIQNLVSQSLAMADTLMVTSLGEAALAAVSAANTPFFILTILSFGIQSGACVLVAQYYGRGDRGAINRILGVAMYASVIVLALFSALICVFPRETMSLVTNNPELIGPGAEYARTVSFASLFSGISLMYISVQRSMENPKLGMWVLSLSGVLNVILNYLLIYGKLGLPALGVRGAALATLICRICEVAAVSVYAMRAKNLRLDFKKILKPGRAIVKDFIKYAIPVTLNESLWAVGTSLYSVIMGHMPGSTPILAAYAIIVNIDRIVSVGVFAMGNAAAVIIGKEIGTGNTESVYGKGVALCTLGFCLGLLNTAVFLILRFCLADNVLYPLLNLSGEACGIASMMLVMLAVVTPLRTVDIITVTGLLRGGGDVKRALLLDILPMYCFTLPLACAFGLVFKLGIVFVYGSMVSDEIIKIFFGLRRIASKKWINNVTRELQ